jgi:hypothetical protein
MNNWILIPIFLFSFVKSFSQSTSITLDSSFSFEKISSANKKFITTSEFLDASINSLNFFVSLIKKENYRNKITSFNNPTSSEMGFNLENEIQTALKPLLAKAKITNIDKFSQVISSLVAIPSKTTGTILSKSPALIINPLFSTLLGIVGNLTITEKKITLSDLDSFITATSKYFIQYEKLNQANNLFDQNIDRLNTKLEELQYDLKGYMVDMISILYKNVVHNPLNTMSIEDMFLKYLDKYKVYEIINFNADGASFQYPSDGIKTAKDLANNLQKQFNEYQKAYLNNYQQIRNILLDSKLLGKSVNVLQIESSLKDLEELYNASKNSDVLALRFTTLFERLKTLVASEQLVK